MPIDPKLEGFNKFYQETEYLIKLWIISFQIATDTHISKPGINMIQKNFFGKKGGGVRLLEEEEISKIPENINYLN